MILFFPPIEDLVGIEEVDTEDQHRVWLGERWRLHDLLCRDRVWAGEEKCVISRVEKWQNEIPVNRGNVTVTESMVGAGQRVLVKCHAVLRETVAESWSVWWVEWRGLAKLDTWLGSRESHRDRGHGGWGWRLLVKCRALFRTECVPERSNHVKHFPTVLALVGHSMLEQRWTMWRRWLTLARIQTHVSDLATQTSREWGKGTVNPLSPV